MQPLNSSKRPGGAARPRSPASRFPVGVLNNTGVSLWRESSRAMTSAGSSYGTSASIAVKPASAAAAKRAPHRLGVDRGEMGFGQQIAHDPRGLAGVDEVIDDQQVLAARGAELCDV